MITSASPQAEPLALYVHWPFCLNKCPYCDFNSHVRPAIDHPLFARALSLELQHEAGRLGRRPLGSIFFGGGTPSLMQPETVAQLIEQACALFDPLPGLEITLEANPTSVELAKLESFQQAGVNRISLGIQSLDAAMLKQLGRQHSVHQALQALEMAQTLFSRTSFDLIYARPGQTPGQWRKELRQALSYSNGHLSLYQLTIEPGTRFATLFERGELILPHEETAALLYRETTETAADYGLVPYEISNYARPGEESRHNLTYWRYGDYAGIGPGAHSRLSLGRELRALHRHRNPERWAAQVMEKGHGTLEETSLSLTEKGHEMLLMGLRLAEGLDTRHFEQRSGCSLMSLIDPAMLDACCKEGYLVYDSATHRLVATPEGRLRLEAVLAALLR